MKEMFRKFTAVVMAVVAAALAGCRKELERAHKDERGVEIIIVIILLAILVSIAALFRTQITAFVNNLFTQILAF